jgi:integrase
MDGAQIYTEKPQPLTAAIIAYMQAGEERGDAQCAGLRVRCLASGQKVFFYVPWSVHDLRRTVATGLAKLGCPRVVQDRIVNHVDTSVSAIYDRHHYNAEARDWLQKWADHVEALTVSNVVPLPATRAA